MNQISREDVIAWVVEHPGLSLTQVGDVFAISPRTVSAYIRGTEAETVLVTSRPGHRRLTDEEMLEAIRIAWRNLEPNKRISGMSKSDFQRLMEHGRSASAYDRRFGSWSAACAEAGVPARKSTRTSGYRQKYSDDDIIQMLDAYMTDVVEAGGAVTYRGYTEWATASDRRPSGDLVRNRFGTWNNARRAVFDYRLRNRSGH